MRLRPLLTLLVGLAACATTPAQESARTLTTASGAPFVLPPRWTAEVGAGLVVLEGPDGDASVALVEVAAAERDAAVAAAWARWRPGFDRPVFRALEVPPRDGWEAIAQIVYVTPSEDAWLRTAIARRLGATWYVALLDGPVAGVDRRAAQIDQIVESWSPEGLEAERFGGRPAHALAGERLAVLDAFIEDARRRIGIPGVAVAVVEDGEVVLSKGYGTRAVEDGRPVTPETLFMIGSTTKSLTTLLMARLVDEGRFGWDTPTRTLLPELRLADPEVTERLRVRDTVCACAGLPRQDMEMLFEYDGVLPEDRVASMAGMRPTTGFGETFQYSNTMVASGGYLAGRAVEPEGSLGDAYDRAMARLVFEPLRMDATTFDFERVAAAEHAVPHGRRLPGRAFVPLPLAHEQIVRSVRPAGGAWSNARDMSRYLLLELREGMGPEGTRFVSEPALRVRRTPQVQAGADVAYGLGLFVQEDYGVPVLHHGGNTLGFTSTMFFLPEHGVGMVILANAGHVNLLGSAVKRRLFELLFDGEPRAGRDLAARLERQEAIWAEELATLQTDPEWARPWTGRYRNPQLGELTLTVEDGRAVLDAGEWRTAVGRREGRDGTPQLLFLDPPLTGLELNLGERNGTRTLTLDAGQQVYVFEPQGA